MIDEKYYIGFEGEPEITIYYKEKDLSQSGLKIWIGYFEYILGASTSNDYENGGLIYSYINQDGWYDESPWQIDNLTQAIVELKKFNNDNVESEEETILKKLPDIQKDIIAFLEEAQYIDKVVFIDYE
ncbi:hypothetical protein [Clostridium cibarium]|uniref:Uncharacterized protein n=1 Tax=Clostridium cibarium TaxID=2762247 RepID=A0ABR8PV88_9CLOT|nr:hypothetical protein [Clostridium cibarium]MBD7912079.1 hypothetical protein [Clostridium cibarium]